MRADVQKVISDFDAAYLKMNGEESPWDIEYVNGWYVIRYQGKINFRYRKRFMILMTSAANNFS